MLTVKEQVKAIMLKNFGPSSASAVDFMSDEEVIVKCRAKVAGFFGEEKAKEFDKIK